MKKSLLGLFLVFLMASVSVAASPQYGTTLLNAVTSTGTGSSATIPSNTLSTVTGTFTCVVTWGGTTPTNTVVSLLGSLDNSSFYSLATVTVTASPWMFAVDGIPVKYIEGNYVSKSGGDGTTAVTLICMPGGY